MNLDKFKYERRVSTLSDLMSDVGGFFGLLIMFGSVSAKLWNFNSFDNFLVSRLYKIKKPSEKLSEQTSYFEKSDFFNKSIIPQCITYCCRRNTRKEMAMNKAREKLAQEINVI